MFKITMFSRSLKRELDLPSDTNLRLFDACERADMYKRRVPENIFSVINMETGDCEYQV